MRGHRPRGDPADVGVVPPVGNEEDRAVDVGVEDRRYDGEVGQVRAAGLGMVGQDDVPAPEVLAQGAHLVADGVLHSALEGD